MNFIYNYTLNELSQIFQPSFRAKQLYSWLYTKYISSYEQCSNISKGIIDECSEKYILNPLKLVMEEKSSDGTKKFLFSLHDEHTIESVLILMKKEKIDKNGNIIKQKKYTACISSQVGCKMGCKFCSTAKGGFIRNLEIGEIVAQIVELKRLNDLPSNKALNIVFMGMGEPLDNLSNVSKAITILTDKNGLNISPTRITVSTSGLSSKIELLSNMNLGINLAISLHAVDDMSRSKIMPINSRYDIKSIIKVVKKFPINKRKKIMFEYLLIKGINDDINDADKLIKLLNGIPVKINIILFNSHNSSEFKRPDENDARKFCDYIMSKGLIATIRESKGIDISAACGQLREKKLNVSRETFKGMT